MKGILLINKDINMTSHDVVAILRRKLSMKRIGHTGTLDPMVTGVLPICIGTATRVSEYIMAQGKVYRCRMKFGKSTTTYDAYGEDLEYSDKIEFTKKEILEAFGHFTGQIEQKPPIYSAVKVKGKRLYSYARSMQEVDIPSRKVTIYSLDLISLEDDEIAFDIHCSKGTYVRSLVHDMGIFLGSRAYMKELVRTEVGRFRIEDCIPISDIKNMDIRDIEKDLVNTEDSLYNLAGISIEDDISSRLVNGQKINSNKIHYTIEKNYQDEIDYKNLKVFVRGEFLGIGKIANNILKMERVL